MSIAEKLVKIAENEPKVFNAGKTAVIQGIEPAQINTSIFQEKLQTIANNTLRVYEAGQQLADDLKTTISGTAIRVDDVNSIEHKLGVRVGSKNLAVDLKDREDIAIASNPTLEKPITGTKLFKGITANGYVSSGNILSFNNENGLITFTTKNTSNGIGVDVEVEGGKTYTISAKTISVSSYVVWRVGFYKDGMIQSYVSQQTTFTVPEDCNQVIVSIHPATDNEEISFSDFQLELGTTATPYTPYISDFTGVGGSRYGKNLAVDLKDREYAEVPSGTTTYKPLTGTQLIKGIAANGYTAPARVTELVNDNGIITYFTSNNSYAVGIDVKVKGGETYTASANIISSVGTLWRVGFYKNGLNQSYLTNYTTFTVPDECDRVIITIAPGADNNYITFSNIQLELGNTATEYEPYKEPQTVTANAEGIVEGLTSLAPTMTLIPNSNEVIIEMEYFRDIDLALENQIIEIAMSGGE